jgi:hypothetical protein
MTEKINLLKEQLKGNQQDVSGLNGKVKALIE